jgi:hypothetical protein
MGGKKKERKKKNLKVAGNLPETQTLYLTNANQNVYGYKIKVNFQISSVCFEIVIPYTFSVPYFILWRPSFLKLTATGVQFVMSPTKAN